MILDLYHHLLGVLYHFTQQTCVESWPCILASPTARVKTSSMRLFKNSLHQEEPPCDSSFQVFFLDGSFLY